MSHIFDRCKRVLVSTTLNRLGIGGVRHSDGVWFYPQLEGIYNKENILQLLQILHRANVDTSYMLVSPWLILSFFVSYSPTRFIIWFNTPSNSGLLSPISALSSMSLVSITAFFSAVALLSSI